MSTYDPDNIRQNIHLFTKLIIIDLSFLGLLVTKVAGRLLVDTVVGEVGEHVVHLGALVGVLIGGEPDQAVIIEVDTERVQAGNQDIEPQVKLGLVY